MSKPTLFGLAFLILGSALVQLYAQPTRTQPLRAGLAGVGKPSCIYCPKPGYSKEAPEANYEGDVYLLGVIGLNGRATKLKVLDPGLGLGSKALDTVKTWRFKPALGPNGQPVAAITTIDVRFNLPPARK